jgi:hypothetical protein
MRERAGPGFRRDTPAFPGEEGRRPRIRSADGLWWSLISRWWSDWGRALYFVQPRTVLEWQKKRFRDYWRDLSRARMPGRPRVAPSPKIVLELKKPGIDVAKSTVESYQPRGPRPSSPGWRIFPRLHANEFAAMDFFVVPTAELKVLFVLTYVAYYKRWRTHRSLEGDAPDTRPVRPAPPARFTEIPAVRGLHHYYLPEAA